MNKILNRTMFRNQASKEALSTANGHSHRSTGIASGLEYRDGYAVGGRVGYATDQPGGIVNPDLQTGSGVNIDANRQLAELILKDMPKTDYSQFAIDYTDPALAIDYSKAQASPMTTIGTAAGRTIADPIPEGQSQFATFIGNLSADAADYAARRKELDLLAQAETVDKTLKTKEQEKELSILGAGEDKSRFENIAGLTTQLTLKQLDLLKEKQPNAFTFVEKTLIAQGLDPDKPETWGADGTALVMDTLALATGESTQAQKTFDLNKKKLDIMSELLRTLPDAQKKKIFAGGADYDSFVNTFNNLITAAGMEAVNTVDLNSITIADNNAEILKLAETSELPNLLSNSQDLFTAASDNKNLAQVVIKAQEAQRNFLNGTMTTDQFVKTMEKINEALTRAGQTPINIDLLK